MSGGMNIYGYTENDPIIDFNPSGFEGITVIGHGPSGTPGDPTADGLGGRDQWMTLEVTGET